MTGPPLELGFGVAAAAPLLVLFGLVLWGRFGALVPALAGLGVAALLAVTVFEAGPAVLAVALGKGLWLALWILLVVWPALLLFRIASVGGLEPLGRLFMSILPRRRENLLIVAWVFPSFIQGVAGFGTPIAVTAPLLVAMGWGPVRAIAYPLIGYHWSVTFGSMGSSFYMASLTAGLTGTEQDALALHAAVLLGINCLVAGALVLLMDGGLAGLREGLGTLLAVGVPMATALVGVAVLVPAIATLGSASVGFLAVFVLATLRGRRRRYVEDDEPAAEAPQGQPQGRPLLLLAPYVYLLVLASPVFLGPASADWVRAHLRLGPDFPTTTTGWGLVNAAVTDYNPLAVLAHPGTYIALACLLGYLTFRATGIWAGPGTKGVVSGWLRKIPSSSYSIAVLACLATVLVESGMISVLARGSAEAAGEVYVALAPVIGAVGSFVTGSTTSSNALLASFQAQVAQLIDVAPTALVAAQTAGGNVGNSLAPVVILVGAGAVSAPHVFSQVVRLCLLPAGVLLAVVCTSTAVATLL
jgi:lactate permease